MTPGSETLEEKVARLESELARSHSRFDELVNLVLKSETRHLQWVNDVKEWAGRMGREALTLSELCGKIIADVETAGRTQTADKAVEIRGRQG